MIRRLVLLFAGVAVVAGSVQAADPADRVGFPADYRGYTVLRTANITTQGRLGTIYGNAPAASIHDVAKLPYPNGSVIVMEWATPVKGADGGPITGADGLWKKGEIVRLDVMRREAGYGAAYGAKRAGEWEFASYTPDGRPIAPAIDAAACAACHSKPGAARDFVFRGRFPSLDTM
jgi:cytochrome P460